MRSAHCTLALQWHTAECIISRSRAYFMIEHHHYWRALHLGYYVVRCVRLDLSDRVNASRLPYAHVDNTHLQINRSTERVYCSKLVLFTISFNVPRLWQT